MPNLMITTSCNLQCDYCFAVDMMSGGQAGHNMEKETFLSIMDWIDKSNMAELSIQLMGGEPTMSPLLFDFIEELTTIRSRKVIIFSNGTVPLSTRLIEKTRRERVDWVININHPTFYSAKQQEVVQHNLTLLGRRASLNVNFFSVDISYDHVFEYFDACEIKRLIKIGIALPTSDKSNSYVSTAMFSAIKVKIDTFLKIAQQRNIQVATECGIPACLFKEFLQKYPGIISDEVISHCGSRLDITPDGSLIHCLPLSKIASVKYDSFVDYARASLWFHDLLAPYRAISGIADECFTCTDLSDGSCKVCLANSLGEFNRIVLPPLPDIEDQ